VISLTGEWTTQAYSPRDLKGNDRMTSKLRSRKALTLIVALGAAACVVVLLSIGLTAREPVASAALGPDWQCSRVAFVLTSCTRTDPVESAVARMRKEQAGPRPRV